MALELFGFSIGRVDKDLKAKRSFALPEPEDGAMELGPSGGAYGTYVDLEGVTKNELELIKKYREMATFPECDQAIDDVVNEAVVTNREESPVSVSLEKSKLSDPIKETIKTEFTELVRLLDFRKIGYEMFRKWYVDGRMYFHIIIDDRNPKRGILELRPIDPLKIKRLDNQRLFKDLKVQNLIQVDFKNTICLMKGEFHKLREEIQYKLLLILSLMFILVY